MDIKPLELTFSAAETFDANVIFMFLCILKWTMTFSFT